MKHLPFKLIFTFTLGLGLTLTLLGLMAYLNAKAALAAGPHHVAPDCTGVPAPCYTSVQAAVDAAAPGEIILVAAGTYTGVNFRAGVTQTVYISKSVTIRGGYTTAFTEPSDPKANPTTLDAQGQGRVIYSVGVSPTIEGLQLINGNARVAGDPLGNPVFHGGGLFALSGIPVFSGNTVISNVADYGGGVDVFSGGATLSHNLIAANTALHGGGGVRVSSGTITMESNLVMSNTAPFGSGAFGDGGEITLNGGLFQNNSCTDSACYGGGVAVYGTLHLTGTQFISNTARSGGGGAFASNGATLNGALFQNNTCTNSDCYGGGLAVSGPTSLTETQFLSNTSAYIGGGALLAGPATLYGGLFQNNHSLSSFGGGGGLWMNGALILTGTKFIDNRAEFDGGGLNHRGTGSVNRIVNAVFAGNSANHSGTALFLNSSGSIEILHTTIASPTVGFGAGIVINNGTVGITNTLIASYTTGISQSNGAVYEDYNLFFGMAVSKTGTFAPNSGANDVTGSPAFINPAGGDYHLGPTSAAIDRGINTGVTTDIDGESRLQGTAPDLGADESLLPQGCEAYPLALPESILGDHYPAAIDLFTDSGPSQSPWVSWNPIRNSEIYLTDELQNPALSLTDFTDVVNFTDHSLSIGDSVHHNSGTMNSNDFYAELDRLIGSGITMRVPVWDFTGGSGSNSYYHISDFILVKITGFTSTFPHFITLIYLGPTEDPETCRDLGVDLVPAQSQSGSPGQVLTYTHRLTNLGRFTETALLTYTTSPTGWPVTVTPYSQTLGPGQAVTVTALVTVPLDSPDGLTQLTTLTASLAVSPAVSAAVTDTTTVVNGPRLSLGKSGPITATPGSPITYTLTITNSGNLTAANLVITDAIPAGAIYVSGGTKVGNIVSWTLPSLAANGGVTHTSFVVTATQMITNSDYGVQADGGYRGQGNEAVVTVVGEVTTEQSVFLPVILKK